LYSSCTSFMFVVFHNFPQYWRNVFSSIFHWIRAVSFTSLLIYFKILYTLGWVLYVSCSKFVTNLSQESLCLFLTSLLASAVFILYSSLSSCFFEFNHFLYNFFFVSINWCIWSFQIFKYFLLFRLFVVPKLSFGDDFSMFCKVFHSLSVSYFIFLCIV